MSGSLLLTNDVEIKNLNKQFRKINKPTDVLSFQLNKKEQLEQKYLGDIVISLQTAKKQAIKTKKDFKEELTMLITHGYLHLLGYDHKSPKEAKTMFTVQNEILKELK